MVKVMSIKFTIWRCAWYSYIPYTRYRLLRALSGNTTHNRQGAHYINTW